MAKKAGDDVCIFCDGKGVMYGPVHIEETCPLCGGSGKASDNWLAKERAKKTKKGSS
jgi:DnaJ-class molecular chaperone